MVHELDLDFSLEYRQLSVLLEDSQEHLQYRHTLRPSLENSQEQFIYFLVFDLQRSVNVLYHTLIHNTKRGSSL
jgi:hypothetical protein